MAFSFLLFVVQVCEVVNISLDLSWELSLHARVGGDRSTGIDHSYSVSTWELFGKYFGFLIERVVSELLPTIYLS